MHILTKSVRPGKTSNGTYEVIKSFSYSRVYRTVLTSPQILRQQFIEQRRRWESALADSAPDGPLIADVDQAGPQEPTPLKTGE